MKQAVIALVAAATLLAQVARAEDAPASAPTSSGNFYTGDAKVVALHRYANPAALAKPANVVVEDFKVPLDTVAIDDSLAARVHRHHQLRKGEDVDSTPAVLASHVQSAFSQAMVAELKKAHVPVATGAAASRAAVASDLVVSGEFVAMDEGDETQRVMIGFGLGASDVKAHVRVSTAVEGRPVVLLEFDVTAESNKKPGAAITSSGSLATGAAKKAFGDRKSKVENDAARLGKLAAEQVEGVMSDRTWNIPAGTVAHVDDVAVPPPVRVASAR